MTSQNTVLGIAVGMFLGGLALGYVAFVGSTHSGGMMMNNQQTWMQDTQHIEQMSNLMKENHDFAMGMMITMIEDPALRLQMIRHMTDNPESMQQIMNMKGSNMMINDMSGDMMGSGMQGMMNQDMVMQMMQDPETREKMIQSMSKHVGEMQDLLSSELTNDEFNTKMTELIESHMKEMQTLMFNQSIHNSMK